MGRKRNQGRARKAAKAKAKQNAEEGNKQTDVDRQQTPETQIPQFQISGIGNGECMHGFAPLSLYEIMDRNGFEIIFQFSTTFLASYDEAAAARGSTTAFSRRSCLIAAANSTLDEYADVWSDPAKMKLTMSYFLSIGTQQILNGDYETAWAAATFARYFEQHIAVRFKQTQALLHWHKNCVSDVHTLVKFFRHRIPCSCLDEKYEEVKNITKMDYCYNPHCSIPHCRVERSKTMYCSRCRCVVYCSRGCQKAHWSTHKPVCDKRVALIAKFEERQDS